MTGQQPRHHRARIDNSASSRRERIKADRHSTRRPVAYRNIIVTDDWPSRVSVTATEKSIIESIVNGNPLFPKGEGPGK